MHAAKKNQQHTKKILCTHVVMTKIHNGSVLNAALAKKSHL